MKVLIQSCLKKRYQHIDIGRNESYFVKKHAKSNYKYKQNENIPILQGLGGSVS